MPEITNGAVWLLVAGAVFYCGACGMIFCVCRDSRLREEAQLKAFQGEMEFREWEKRMIERVRERKEWVR